MREIQTLLWSVESVLTLLATTNKHPQSNSNGIDGNHTRNSGGRGSGGRGGGSGGNTTLSSHNNNSATRRNQISTENDRALVLLRNAEDELFALSQRFRIQLDVRLLFLLAKNLTNGPDAVVCTHDSPTLTALLDQKGVLDLGGAGAPESTSTGSAPPHPLGAPPAPLTPSPCVIPWSWVLFTGPLRLMQPTGVALVLGHVDVQVGDGEYTPTHPLITHPFTRSLSHTLILTLFHIFSVPSILFPPTLDPPSPPSVVGLAHPYRRSTPSPSSVASHLTQGLAGLGSPLPTVAQVATHTLSYPLVHPLSHKLAYTPFHRHHFLPSPSLTHISSYPPFPRYSS